MRLLRMTTRRWMTVITTIGVALGGVETLRRQAIAFAMASRHGDVRYAIMNGYVPDRQRVRRLLDGYEKYHRDMEQKWRRAARYPWLPVEPNPPRPWP